jgi:HSP20 family molecular chaperone IbpA
MTEAAKAPGKELEVQDKKELTQEREQTLQGRFFTPLTDIYETTESLVVVMEIPGVPNSDLDIKLEKDQLTVEARISVEPYSNLKPLYTEYNVGHFSRSFRLSNEIDKDSIRANVADGVLTLNLPKVQEAAARTISIE